MVVERMDLARELEAHGKSRQEIARLLGISETTYRRWRKAAVSAAAARGQPKLADDPISRLQAENELLRQVLSDLLAERIGLEEQLQKVPVKAD
jgi:putative transposase